MIIREVSQARTARTTDHPLRWDRYPATKFIDSKYKAIALEQYIE